MTQLIKEAKRFQELAGILKENTDNLYKIQLKINNKPVMETTADGEPSPEELSDTLTFIQSKYKDKYDFSNAELVVIDPSGKQISSISAEDYFLKTKTTHTGDSYPSTHGTV